MTDALDYFPTPRWCIDSVMPQLPLARSVLDPCCGKGELLAAFPSFVTKRGIELHALRAEAARVIADDVEHADALTVNWHRGAQLLVMNPPFTFAEAFVRRALGWLEGSPRATVAVLLRLSFLEPTDPEPKLRLEGRAELHRARPPQVWVLPERPRFSLNKHGKAGTDNVTAAWFIYGPGRVPTVNWLDGGS